MSSFSDNQIFPKTLSLRNERKQQVNKVSCSILFCNKTCIYQTRFANFIAFCKNRIDHQWYRYNDEIVTSKDKPIYQNNGNLDEKPCILFYQKIKKLHAFSYNFINLLV